MVDALNPIPKQLPTFKEQYVPLPNRESQNVSWKPFVYETVKLLLITKLSSLAGYFIGKEMGKKNVMIGKFKVGGQLGALVLGTAGATYELFHHWKKTEGQRLGVSNISNDLKAAMDPAQLAIEAKKEEAFVADLVKLQQLQSAPKSHAADITERREQASNIERANIL